ncbi:MAG: site-specific integrase [Acidimicrobiales bacterium]
MTASPRRELAAFVAFLAKERNDSPHTVRAYGRDVSAFAAFCDRFYGGPWTWGAVDRLAIRGFLSELHGRRQSTRSEARALSALRSF